MIFLLELDEDNVQYGTFKMLREKMYVLTYSSSHWILINVKSSHFALRWRQQNIENKTVRCTVAGFFKI